MAAEVEEALGLETELIPGDGGVFDVEADGTVIFSKHDAGRYPEPSEIVASLRRLAAPPAP